MLGYILFLMVLLGALSILIFVLEHREVFENPPVLAKLYSMKNYGGSVYSIQGNQNKSLKWADLSPYLSDIKSLQVADGYIIIAYEEDNFAGNYAVFKGSSTTIGKKREGDYPSITAIPRVQDRLPLQRIRSIEFKPFTEPSLNNPVPLQPSRYIISTPCRMLKTPENEQGYGANYLDRHNIQCNNDEYLSNYTLRQTPDRKIYYEYSCCKADMENEDPSNPIITKNNTVSTTPINDTVAFQTAYLDRHWIGQQCINDSPSGDNSKLLSRIQLLAHYNPARVQYTYNCTEMKSKDQTANVRNNCKYMSTPWVNEAAGLENHVNLKIGCEAGEGIRDLVLQRSDDGSGKIKQRYVGWCCRPTFEDNKT